MVDHKDWLSEAVCHRNRDRAGYNYEDYAHDHYENGAPCRTAHDLIVVSGNGHDPARHVLFFKGKQLLRAIMIIFNGAALLSFGKVEEIGTASVIDRIRGSDIMG